MSCTQPNYLYVCPGSYEVELKFGGPFPLDKYDEWLKKYPDFFVLVPCGKCLSCRQAHASMWADRCTLEAKQYKDNYFVTLTYDDNYLPVNGSLVPEHLTKFMKKLRKKLPEGVRFFACGEYGGASLRPHYHLILFNCPLDDLNVQFELLEADGRFHKRNSPSSNSKGLFYSRTIYDAWDHKGMISVAYFNYQTAAYVAGYVDKKANLKRENAFKKLGLAPEFIRMSRRPGIGASCYSKDLIDKDVLIIPKAGGAKFSQMPRYFQKLLEEDDPIFYEIYKDKKFQQKLNINVDYLNSDRNYQEFCRIRDKRLNSKINLRNKL